MRVVTACSDKTARIWDVKTGQQLGPAVEHGDCVGHATFDRSDRYVATASWDRTARVWDASSGSPVSPPMQHAGRVNTAVFSRDGRRVVTASEDKTARVWDALPGAQVSRPVEHAGNVLQAVFSSDGRSVATASGDGTARVWGADTGEARTPPLSHRDKVHSVAFSPDGRLVATASEDGTARVWDAATGQPAMAPLRHATGVTRAVFSPDGQGDERLFYSQDANFNVTALVEADGDVAERYDYDAYGRVTVLEPTDWSKDSDNQSDYGNDILYCGYRHDPETGLYHVRHRMYHVTLGRWMQRDPVGYADGANLYAAYFVPAGVDPYGLASITAETLKSVPATIFTENGLGGTTDVAIRRSDDPAGKARIVGTNIWVPIEAILQESNGSLGNLYGHWYTRSRADWQAWAEQYLKGPYMTLYNWVVDNCDSLVDGDPPDLGEYRGPAIEALPGSFGCDSGPGRSTQRIDLPPPSGMDWGNRVGAAATPQMTSNRSDDDFDQLEPASMRRSMSPRTGKLSQRVIPQPEIRATRNLAARVDAFEEAAEGLQRATDNNTALRVIIKRVDRCCYQKTIAVGPLNSFGGYPGALNDWFKAATGLSWPPPLKK